MTPELFPHSAEVIQGCLAALLMALLRHFSANRKSGARRDAAVTETGDIVQQSLREFGGQLAVFTQADAKASERISILETKFDMLMRADERKAHRGSHD